jgi:energy-coupling factor transporter ATP-binding protein EcfA2
MDEPTEGLAPVIVAQVEDMLHRLAEADDMAVLVIEQNIGVATAVSETVAIMVNGRVNRLVPSATLAQDRELQQRLLGVGRHGDDGGEPTQAAAEQAAGTPGPVRAASPPGPVRVYVSNPVPPTRWSQPVQAAQIERAARTATAPPLRGVEAGGGGRAPSAQRPSEPHVVVAGTFDTKGAELRYIRDILQAEGLRTRPSTFRPRAAFRAPRCRPSRSRCTTAAARRRSSRPTAARRWPPWPTPSATGSGARRASPASSRRAARAARRWRRRGCARCRSACRR